MHPSLSYSPSQVQGKLGRELSKGELGCFSSHYGLWEQLLDSDVEQLLVIEDDVIIDWNFVTLVCDTRLSEHGVDYLRLSYKNPAPSILRTRGFIDSQHHLVELFGFAWGTQAYVITKAGAAAFCEACRKIELPLDDQMDRSWEHGIPNYSLFPPVALEEFVPSHIGRERYADPAAAAGVAAFRAQEQKKINRNYRAARLKRAVSRRIGGAG